MSRTPLEQLEYLINLWDAVCIEQEKNNFNWEATKQTVLSTWDNNEWSLDMWVAYMESSIIWAAREVVHQSKQDKEQDYNLETFIFKSIKFYKYKASSHIFIDSEKDKLLARVKEYNYHIRPKRSSDYTNH